MAFRTLFRHLDSTGQCYTSNHKTKGKVVGSCNSGMATYQLSKHFDTFFRRLNPTGTFEATASSQYNTIKGLIENPNGSAAILQPSCFLQGSYKQQTAIHSINDIDIVALCQLWQPGVVGGRSFSRDDIFRTVAQPLVNDRRYKDKVRFGPSSMCVKVDLGIKVEILPVVYRAGNVDSNSEPFKLYRPSSALWENGFAKYHQRFLSAKNACERTGGNFIPAIKVFKHLRSLIGLNAVSFHIECLLYSLPDGLFQGAPADYIPALLAYVASVSADAWYANVIRTPCGDRDIFTSAEWSPEAWNLFHEWVGKWNLLAWGANSASRMSESIRYWKVLLGDGYFPEAAL